MATHSTHVSQCNHRGLEMAVIILTALVAALIAGIMLARLGMTPLLVLVTSAGAFTGTFTVGITAVKYVKQIN